jgi:catechol 2,3-dioxygenase-like lactoylglutathione lyase family enzyme
MSDAEARVYEPSHIGLCVTDVARSLRFYRDGLGFTVGEQFHLTRPIAEVDPPVDVISQFINLGGLTIELLDYVSPGTFGAPHHRRNQLGLTHLSFIVDDVEARARELERAGGTILPDTRNDPGDPSIRILFVADPDGNRVELMSFPQGPPPHVPRPDPWPGT